MALGSIPGAVKFFATQHAAAFGEEEKKNAQKLLQTGKDTGEEVLPIGNRKSEPLIDLPYVHGSHVRSWSSDSRGSHRVLHWKSGEDIWTGCERRLGDHVHSSPGCGLLRIRHSSLG